MTRDFDPDIHQIVAVVNRPGHPDHGQHFHVGMPDLAAEIEEATRKLKAERSTSPLVPVPMPEITDRIEALELHASAHQDLSQVLRLCLQMAEESEARTAKLEMEAQTVNATLRSVIQISNSVLR